MDEKPMDFTMDEKPMDLSAINASGPIDLTTWKHKNCDQDEWPKRQDVVRSQITDMQRTFTQYSGGISINTETRLLTQEFPFDTKPANVPGSLSSPIGNDASYKESGGLRVKLASNMASLSLSSPPIIQASTSPTNSLGSRSLILSSPSLQSPGLHTSTDKETLNKRYMSASRPFNVLAKKLLGDIDCPPRPGHRQRSSHSSSGGTGKKDDNESEEAYLKRRGKNNIAARRSRDKRKIKCGLLKNKSIECKEQSLNILKEIAGLQEILLERGYKHPLPYRDEIKFLNDDLYMYVI